MELRVWQADAGYVKVLVHSPPAGDMRQPDTTPLDAAGLKAFQAIFADCWGGAPMVNWADLIGEQQLAATLLPPSVFSLLIRSLGRILADDGLRIRLCPNSAP